MHPRHLEAYTVPMPLAFASSTSVHASANSMAEQPTHRNEPAALSSSGPSPVPRRSPHDRVSPERGPTVLADITVAERMLEISGMGTVLSNPGAQQFLIGVRESAENPRDSIERMHLDLIAASHQLTLRFHANAARDDVSHDVAVAYAGAATQLLGGFAAMSKSLDSHRVSRRNRVENGK